MAEQELDRLAIDGYERSGSRGKVDIIDEYQPELRGRKGRRKIREMTNDETIGAIRLAIDMFFRGTTGNINPATDDAIDADTAAEYADWLEDVLFESLNWDDFIVQAFSCIDFGWSYADIVPARRADGTFGIGEYTFVAQETLDGWELSDDEKVIGLHQRAPSGSRGPWTRYIPLTRAVHFIAGPYKGSPEGRSSYRHAYRPYYYKCKAMAIEAIQMERGCGFPVLYIDGAVSAAADRGEEWAVGIKAWAPEFVANIKQNSQSGAVLYTSPYMNVGADGSTSYSSMRKMELKFETPQQSNAVDTDKVIKRYDASMARALLAMFLMLGSDGSGSLSLGQDQSNLFLKAIQGWLEMVYATVNRQLVPMLWALNGFPDEYMPRVSAGDVTTKTATQVAAFVRDLAAAGILLTDDDTEDYLREVGGLPPKPEADNSLPPLPTED